MKKSGKELEPRPLVNKLRVGNTNGWGNVLITYGEQKHVKIAISWTPKGSQVSSSQ